MNSTGVIKDWLALHWLAKGDLACSRLRSPCAEDVYPYSFLGIAEHGVGPVAVAAMGVVSALLVGSALICVGDRWLPNRRWDRERLAQNAQLSGRQALRWAENCVD